MEVVEISWYCLFFNFPFQKSLDFGFKRAVQ
jgi:hypothetical protein